MSDWKLGRRQGVCARCEHEFADGEAHYSVLLLSADDVAREDACNACWARGEPEPDSIWWRTRRSEKKRGLELDLEALEALYNALEPRSEQRLRELRYLLCLILVRKRRLKVVRVLRLDDGEAFSVRRPRRTEESVVHVFDLTPERQESLRRDLQAIFEGDDPGAIVELAAEAAEPPED